MAIPAQTTRKSDSTLKHVLLGLTGGVAAYKAAELARLLIKERVDVQVVMTESALRFLGPATFHALTGKAVLTGLWDSGIVGGMAHIELSRDADLILVAPASANFIAKLAHGLSDDLLSTLCLARDCPLLVAPAMNRQMWENPATQRNLTALQRDGVAILGPASGAQACGEVGMGRMLEAQEIAEKVLAFSQPKVLQGQRLLITAGPTYEAIDPVRGITNLSSGKMGYAIAQAAIDAGAEVTLISGRVGLSAPPVTKFISVISAQDMLTAVKDEVPRADVFVSVAAVADYCVKNPGRQKTKKTTQNIVLELTPNPDILEFVAGLPNPPFCVGFAAETDNLDEHAEAKRRKKKLPLLVGNLVQDAVNSDECALTLFDNSGRHHLAKAPKIQQARHLIKHIAELHKKGTEP